MNEEGRWIISALVALVVVFLGTFLWNLIRAPVYIKWEREKRTRLNVIDKYEEEYFATNGGRIGLILRNEGTDVLNNCHARLIGMDFEVSNSKRTLGRIPTNKDIPCDKTIGGLSNSKVQVMTWQGLMSQEQTQIEYLDGTSNWIPVWYNQPVILLLHIWGDNTRSIYVALKISTRTGWGFDLCVLKSAPLEGDIKLSDFQTITSDKGDSQT